MHPTLFILQLDRHWRLVSAQPAFLELCGQPAHAVLNRPLADFLSQTDFMRIQHQCRTADPTPLYVMLATPVQQNMIELSVTPLDHADGWILAGHSVSQQAAESISYFPYQTTSDWFWEVDENLLYTRVSPGITQILGYEPHEIIGKSPFDLMPPEEALRVRTIAADIVRQHQPFDRLINHNRHKQGHLVSLETSGVPVFDATGEFRGYRGIDRDVTERLAIECALRESEARFNRSQAVANLGTWEWHIDSGELYWSEVVYKLFDVEPDSFRPHYLNFLKLIHPLDQERVINSIHESLSNRTDYDVQHRIIRQDGALRWLRQRGNVLDDPQGNPERMYGVIQDVSDIKQAETLLRESEQRFRQLAEHIREVFFIRDIASNTMLYVSPAYETVWGRSLEEIYRDPESFIDCIHPEDKQRVLEAVKAQNRGIPFNEEYRIIRADQQVRWIWARTFPVWNNNNQLQRVVGLAEDITDIKHAEQTRLNKIREQRDTLIREVHHRIKNNLQGIIGLLRSEMITLDSDLNKSLERMISQISSIALIHGLQGKRASSALFLCEMIPAIIQSLSSADEQQLRSNVNIDQPLQIAEEEAVPVALVLNELLTNALKHQPDAPVEPVAVELIIEGSEARISIFSPGSCLPEGFDFARGRHTGTGLELVAALLPHRGAVLEFRQQPDGVMTTLNLQPPVVFHSMLKNTDLTLLT